MLWLFFALALMPLVVEMVAAYPHVSSRPIYINMSYMYVSGPTCNRAYKQPVLCMCMSTGPTGKWLLLVLLLNVNVHVGALFINL